MATPTIEWTGEETAALQRLHNEGQSYDAIAERLGRTRQSVKGKVCRLRIGGASPLRHFDWTPEKLAELRELRAEGYSFALIAEKLGCSKGSAIGKAHRMGLPLNEKPKHALPSTPGPRQVPRKRRDTGGGQQQRFLAAVSRNEAAKLRIGSYGRPTLVEHKRPKPRFIADEPRSRNLTLLQLTDATCKWAHGDEAPFSFCGHETFGALPPYCPFHARMATVGCPKPLSDAERERRNRARRQTAKANFGFVPFEGRATA